MRVCLDCVYGRYEYGCGANDRQRVQVDGRLYSRVGVSENLKKDLRGPLKQTSPPCLQTRVWVHEDGGLWWVGCGCGGGDGDTPHARSFFSCWLLRGRGGKEGRYAVARSAVAPVCRLLSCKQ